MIKLNQCILDINKVSFDKSGLSTQRSSLQSIFLRKKSHDILNVRVEVLFKSSKLKKVNLSLKENYVFSIYAKIFAK
jgi:hypothetical protein